MKIFYINPMSYANLAVYDYELLKDIEADQDVYYFCNVKYNCKYRLKRMKNIYKYSDKKIKFASYIWSQVILMYYILIYKPECIHFQWIKIPTIDYYLIKMIKKFPKAPKVIFTAHNAFGHDLNNKNKAIYTKIFKAIDKIIVHTQTTQNEIKSGSSISKDKIEIIPHGVLKIDMLCGKANKDLMKNYLDIKDELIFSALGNMSYYKGTDLIIDAWKKSKKLQTNKRIKLIIAGRNHLGKINTKGLNNVIIIDRFLTDAEFLSLLRMTDIVTMPYRKISQSGLLLSALSERKHLLVSDVGELTVPFHFGNIGWIISKPDSNELKEMLEQIVIEVEEKGKPQVESAIWDKIDDYYSWGKIAKRTHELYTSFK